MRYVENLLDLVPPAPGEPAILDATPHAAAANYILSLRRPCSNVCCFGRSPTVASTSSTAVLARCPA
jgi:hypothetical protein